MVRLESRKHGMVAKGETTFILSVIHCSHIYIAHMIITELFIQFLNKRKQSGGGGARLNLTHKILQTKQWVGGGVEKIKELIIGVRRLFGTPE